MNNKYVNLTADVIRLEEREGKMWDQYRNETDQTITIIGVLILSAKLCMADGHFTSLRGQSRSARVGVSVMRSNQQD